MAYIIYTVLQKCGNALEKWGFGQYWHESFLICDNFALIRDNTNYENIFYYINSLYIEKTSIFDSSKYPPLAAITALHNLGIRAVIDLIYYSKPPEGLPKDDSHWLDTCYGHHGPVPPIVAQLGWGRVIVEVIPWQTWCQLTVSSPNRICTAWKCDIVQNHTFLGRFQTFGWQCMINVLNIKHLKYINMQCWGKIQLYFKYETKTASRCCPE